MYYKIENNTQQLYKKRPFTIASYNAIALHDDNGMLCNAFQIFHQFIVFLLSVEIETTY